jgi:hypothetical protein
MLTHREFVKKILSDPAVQAEYDTLAEEFALLDELLRARQIRLNARRTQTQDENRACSE